MLGRARDAHEGLVLAADAVPRVVHAQPCTCGVRLSAQLAVGQTVAVRGDGIASPLGRVVAARELGASTGQLQPLQVPRGPGGERRAPPPPQGGPAAPPPKF